MSEDYTPELFIKGRIILGPPNQWEYDIGERVGVVLDKRTDDIKIVDIMTLREMDEFYGPFY